MSDDKTFAEALFALQNDIKPAVKDSNNPAFKSKYADLAAVWEAIKEPLSKHGFCVIQTPDFDAGDLWLETKILHKSGNSIIGRYPLRPTKQDPQGYGSALTYARRYSISAMLGVIADDDDDGNAASRRSQPKAPVKTITMQQRDTLQSLLDNTGKTAEAFCTYFKIDAMPDLPATDYLRAVNMLEKKLKSGVKEAAE